MTWKKTTNIVARNEVNLPEQLQSDWFNYDRGSFPS